MLRNVESSHNYHQSHIGLLSNFWAPFAYRFSTAPSIKGYQNGTISLGGCKARDMANA